MIIKSSEGTPSLNRKTLIEIINWMSERMSGWDINYYASGDCLYISIRGDHRVIYKKAAYIVHRGSVDTAVAMSDAMDKLADEALRVLVGMGLTSALQISKDLHET